MCGRGCAGMGPPPAVLMFICQCRGRLHRDIYVLLEEKQLPSITVINSQVYVLLPHLKLLHVAFVRVALRPAVFQGGWKQHRGNPRCISPPFSPELCLGCCARGAGKQLNIAKAWMWGWESRDTGGPGLAAALSPSRQLGKLQGISTSLLRAPSCLLLALLRDYPLGQEWVPCPESSPSRCLHRSLCCVISPCSLFNRVQAAKAALS